MTGGIKIPISADPSGFQQATDAMASGVNKVTQSAKQLQQAATGVGSQLGNGMDKASLAAKKVAEQLERAKRAQAELAKLGSRVSTHDAGERVKDYDYWRDNTASPAMRRRLAGTSFDSLLGGGWRNMANNETASRRQFQDLMRQMGMGDVALPGGGSPGFGAFMRRAFGGAASTVAGGFGAGGGLAQQIAAQAAAGGGAGGVFSRMGMARLLGGGALAVGAYGIARGIGAARAKIGSAEDEQVAYSDMLRKMGATSSTFDQLRDSVRTASKNLDLSFGDGAKMAGTYLHASGADGIGSSAFRKELMTAGNFSRVMGIDPEASAGLFGALRHNKVSGGDADNKRFAMLIGEAVARAGVFSKADEVMAAVENYTKLATSASLSPANSEGYIGALGNLLNLKQAGLDPNGAASMLGTVDNSFRHGGGEAQRNFLLGALQKAMPGMTAVDMGFMQDKGMFATASSVFGKDGAAYQAADPATQARYDKLAKQGGDRTFFDLAMGQMSGMSSDLQRKNMMGLFGLNDSHAAALQQTVALHGGNLSQTMLSIKDKYGVDPTKLNGTSMRNMLDIEYGDSSQLKSKAAWFRTQGLSSDDDRELKKAEAAPGVGNEELKHALMKLAGRYNMEMTAGDESRKNMVNMENLANDVATKLIPLTNSIREGITSLANRFGANYNDTFGNSTKASSALDDDLGKIGNNTAERYNRLKAEADKVNGNRGAYTQEYRDKINAQLADAGDKVGPTNVGPVAAGALPAEMESFSGDPAEFMRKTRRAAEIAAAKMGGKIKPEWIQGQWGLETGWGKKVLKGTNNLGNIKGGKNGKVFNAPEQYPDGTMHMVPSRFRTYKNTDEFANDYGDLMNSWRFFGVKDADSKADFARRVSESGYATDKNYNGSLLGAINTAEKFGATPLPAGAKATQAGAGALPVQEVSITLRDKSGAAMADPVRLQVGGGPRPAGVR
jgi:flagellum-specific peptidoglycan hydrolase FlgJ